VCRARLRSSGFEQFVQWRYDATGIVAFAVFTIGVNPSRRGAGGEDSDGGEAQPGQRFLRAGDRSAEPDDAKNRQVAQSPVGKVDDGQLADGRHSAKLMP
jgi:hypothetical protein